MDPRRPPRRGTIVALAPVAVLALVLALGLAACDPFAGPTTGPSVAVAAPTPTPTPTPTPSPTPRPTPTPTPTPTPVRASPTPSGTLGSGSVGACPGKTVTSGSGTLVTDQSTNWSGYAVTPNTARVTCIEASWTQPTVTCAKSGHSAISVWVGIGGFDQGNLEQVGSEVDCDSGKASHFLWHESLPRERFEQRLGLLVRAGDHLRARVRSISSTRYELAIANVTRSTSFTVVDTNTRIKATSGEWILEAPTGGCPSACKILAMPNFHKFTFSSTWVTVGGVRQPLDGTSFTHIRVRMVTKSGTTRSQVTSTATDGSSFALTWRRP